MVEVKQGKAGERMIRKGWEYAVDESLVENHGGRYPYIGSPEGERLWLADLDPRQSALAERLVEAANLGNRMLGISAAKVRVSRKNSTPLRSKRRRRRVSAP